MNMKKLLNNRLIYLGLAAILEIIIYITLFRYVRDKAGWVEVILHIAAVVIVLHIIRTSRHLSSDMMWLVLIMIAPVPGTAIFLLCSADLLRNKTFRAIVKEQKKAVTYLQQDMQISKELQEKYPERRSSLSFIPSSGYPFYRNQGYDYFPLGDIGWKVMLEEMKKAERYIFMEYFIIEEGEMFNSMLEILEQKVKEGVECRVMYDDMGSIDTIPSSYAKKLEAKGIKAVSFNRVTPIINVIMNHRDHRKILVIDGKTAFTGGINLADEYINVKVIHGHWKDNVVRVRGEAVWSLLVTFLTNWNALRHEDADYNVFRPVDMNLPALPGFIAPYADTPLDQDLTAQSIYEDILNGANDYVYIMTPYLIIDSEMINTLIHTARKGVDVRIIMPGIPDKKIVWDIGRSYYPQLLDAGVKIYEYEPGFVHAKVFLSDDMCATVGSINLDYRSLYLHFENGTFMIGTDAIRDIRKDFNETFEKCRQVHLDDLQISALKAIFLSGIRIFTPMM